MMKYYLSLLSFILVFQVYSQEIAQWRGANRDGIYSETGLLKQWPSEGPKLLWHFDELGEGHASAAVTKDRVYTAGTSGNNGFVIENGFYLYYSTRNGLKIIKDTFEGSAQ